MNKEIKLIYFLLVGYILIGSYLVLITSFWVLIPIMIISFWLGAKTADYEELLKLTLRSKE